MWEVSWVHVLVKICCSSDAACKLCHGAVIAVLGDMKRKLLPGYKYNIAQNQKR